MDEHNKSFICEQVIASRVQSARGQTKVSSNKSYLHKNWWGNRCSHSFLGSGICNNPSFAHICCWRCDLRISKASSNKITAISGKLLPGNETAASSYSEARNKKLTSTTQEIWQTFSRFTSTRFHTLPVFTLFLRHLPDCLSSLLTDHTGS